MKQASALLADLGKSSLLQLVPGLEQVALEHGTIRAYTPGQEVARQGAAPTHLIIPLNAGLTLIDTARQSRVGLLERRRALALRWALEGQPYPYSAIAEQPVNALHIPLTLFRDVVFRQPQVLHYLRLITRSSGLRSFRTFLQDHGIEPGAMFRLLSAVPLEMVQLGAGDRLPDDSPALYFVRAGRLRITGKNFTRPVIVGEGAFFGGEALVPPTTLSYTVEALEPTALHALPLTALAPLAAERGLTDGLYEEPWLTPSAEAGARRRGVASELPGTVVLPAEVERLGFPIDPRALIRAGDDEESISASLCNLASLSGLRVNPGRIQAGVRLQARTTLLRLAEEIETFGLALSGARPENGVLGAADAPGLLWVGPRLMVFLGAQDGAYYLLDPVRGPIAVAPEALSGLWDGTVLRAERVAPRADESEGTPAPEEGGRAKTSRATAFELLRKHRSLLANVVGLTFLGFAFKLLYPVFMLHIFDDVLLLGRADLVYGLAAGLILTTVLGSLATLARYWVFNELSVRFDNDLSSRFYRKALLLPTSFYQRRRVGDVIARLQEIERVRDFFSGSTVTAAVNILSIFVNAAILFIFSVPIALVGLGMVVVLAGVQLSAGPAIKRLHRRVFDANRRATSLIAEMFAAVTTVKAANAEAILRGRWERSFMDSVKANRQLEDRINGTQAAINAVSGAGTTGVIWFACLAAAEGSISVGSILAISLYLQNMLGPTLGLSSLLSSFEETRVAFDKLEEVFEAEPEESPATALVTHSARLRGKIRLERVTFRYSKDDPVVLKEVSLTIYPGQVVAIVGRSGSGKSTLANIIAGNVKPTTGRVFLDHYDASMLSQACLRRQIGFVQQNYSLFGGTLESNIAYADDAPELVAVAQAASDAHCAEFIEQFPGKYGYTLAPRGVGLSGGQRQRLAIARVLYQAPSILIMDEALSALDADSEATINENMSRITEGRTTIIIAHRISTVRQADRIIVVDDGEIVEDGDHRTLIARGGFYANLFEGQYDADEDHERPQPRPRTAQRAPLSA